MRALPTPHPPKAVRRLAGAALTVAVVGASASAAFAGDAGNLEVGPSPARPGETVTLSTDACGTGGSAGVDASSLGAGIVGLDPENAEDGTVRGTLRIPDDAKPGNYAVGGSCADGSEVTGTVIVAAEAPMATEETKQSEKAPEHGRPAGEQPAADEAGKGNPQDRAAPPGPRHENAQPDQGAGEHGQHARPEDHAKDEHRGRDGHDGRSHHGKDHHGKGRPDDAARHAGSGRPAPAHADGHDPRAEQPHGRVHAGVGGGSEAYDAAQMAGGFLALLAAAAGTFHLRRRNRVPVS